MPVKPVRPLDPPSLTIIKEAFSLADLSTMIRRQPVCAVVPGQKPQVVFDEIYMSIETLRQTLMPNVNFQANRWLFQALTEYLDGQIVEYLTANDDEAGAGSFSMNLNVSSLLSPEFMELADILGAKGRGRRIVELQLVDVYADLGQFYFARDVLRERGFKFCLDGMNHLSLPLIDRKALGFDLVKLFWQRDVYDRLDRACRDRLHRAVQDTDPERLIFARVDSEQALEVGRSLNVSLYQGYLIDGLLEAPDAGEAEEAPEMPAEDADAA